MNTKPSEIVEYWSNVEDECGLSVDWAEAEKLCWRCANETNLERCHIVPRSLGGSELPSNLVLLCSKCHREAPNVSDSKFMWLWLRAHAASYYGTYWQKRGIKEFEFIFSRSPFSTLDASAVSEAAIHAAMQRQMQKISTYFGEGGAKSIDHGMVVFPG